MKKSSIIIPVMVIAGVGLYLYMKHRQSAGVQPTGAPSTGTPTIALSPISTAGMIPLQPANLSPLAAPTQGGGFWQGVMNFLNPGASGQP